MGVLELKNALLEALKSQARTSESMPREPKPEENASPFARNPHLNRILGEVQGLAEKNDARVFIVGGALRDALHSEFHGKGHRKFAVKELDLVAHGPFGKVADAFAKIKGAKVLERKEKNVKLAVSYGDKKGHAINFHLRPLETAGKVEDNVQWHLSEFDFTHNAVGLELTHISSPEWTSKIIHPTWVRPLEDIKAKRLQVMNDFVFETSPARIFRALRFMHKLGLEPSQKTAQLLFKHAREVNSLPPESKRKHLKEVLEEYGSSSEFNQALKALKLPRQVFVEEEREFGGRMGLEDSGVHHLFEPSRMQHRPYLRWQVRKELGRFADSLKKYEKTARK